MATFNNNFKVKNGLDASGDISTTASLYANKTSFASNIVSSAPGSITYWKIATLPVSSAGTYDHLIIDAVLDDNWGSDQKVNTQILFSNRNAFTYRYYLNGTVRSAARVLAYRETDTSISIYLRAGSGNFCSFSYNITHGLDNGTTVIKNPASTTTTPSGTLVFDSSNVSTYVPESYIPYSGQPVIRGLVNGSGTVSGVSFVKSGGTSAQFLKADGSVDSNTYLPTTSSYFAGHNPEGRLMYNTYLTNDMANARLRGSAVAATQNGSPYTISNANWDAMFDGTATFFNISPTSGFTFPLVITVPLPRTLTYGTWVGLSFGSTTFRANSVTIEVFSLDSNSWVTVFTTTTNTSEDIFTAVSGLTNSNATGINQVRYTIAAPNSTQLRLQHLWAYNFNSDMWSQTMMPRAGGSFYGPISPPSITTTGGINATGNWSNSFGGPSISNSIVAIRPAQSNIGLIVQGASGQSGNLTEWQNNTPTTVAYVDPSGVVSSNSYFNVNQASGGIAAQGTYRLRLSNNLIGIGATSPPSVGLVGAGLYLNNATTAPTSSPTGGSILFSEAGALRYRGTSGSNVTIVNADGTDPLLSSNNTFSGTQSMTSPSISTGINTGSTSFDLINTTATTVNAFGAATTLNLGTAANSVTIGNSGTLGSGAQTVNLFTGGSTTGTNQTINLGTGNFGFATQTINIGTGTISSATRTINIGSSSGTGTANLRGTVNFAGTTSPIQLDGSVGTSGQVLTSAGTGATPTWSTVLSANNPLLTSISTVGGGGAEGGQINFARVTDGAQYWSIDSFGTTASPDLRFIENTTERFKLVSGGAISINGSTGTSGQVLRSAGSASAPTWESPTSVAWTGFASGYNYYSMGGGQSNGTVTLNTMTLVPFALTVATTFTKIGIMVNTGGTGSTVRVGIYNSTNGIPSSRLLDAGTVATTTSATLTLITINQTLQPGLYWLAAVNQGATCSSQVKGTGHVPMVPFFGSPANGTARGLQQTGVSGALPDPVGTLAMASTPFEVFLQL